MRHSETMLLGLLQLIVLLLQLEQALVIRHCIGLSGLLG